MLRPYTRRVRAHLVPGFCPRDALPGMAGNRTSWESGIVSDLFRDTIGVGETDIVALETVECRREDATPPWFSLSSIFGGTTAETNTNITTAAEAAAAAALESRSGVQCDHQNVEFIEDTNRGGYEQKPVLLSDNTALIAAIVISVLLAAGCGIGAAVAVVFLTGSLRDEFRRYLLKKLKLDRIKESRDKSIKFTNEFGLTKDTTTFRKEHEVRVLRSLILDPMHWVEVFVFSASANTANAVSSYIRTHYSLDNRPPSCLRRVRNFVTRAGNRKPLGENEVGRTRLSDFNLQLQKYCTLTGFQPTELSAAHPAVKKLGLEIKEVPVKAYIHIRWVNPDLDPPPQDQGIEHYNNNVVLYFIAMRCVLSPLDSEFIPVSDFTASLSEFAALRGDVDALQMGSSGDFAVDPSDLVALDVSQESVFIRELVGLHPKDDVDAAERRLRDQVRPCADFFLVVLHTVMIVTPGAVLTALALMMQTEFVKLNPSTCSAPCDNGGVPYMTFDLLWQAPQLWFYRDTMPWNYVAYGVALLVTFIGVCQMLAYHSGMSQLKDLLAHETTLLSGSRLNGDLKCLDDVRELMLEAAIQPPVLLSKAHDVSVAARLRERKRHHMWNNMCCSLVAYITVGLVVVAGLVLVGLSVVCDVPGLTSVWSNQHAACNATSLINTVQNGTCVGGKIVEILGPGRANQNHAWGRPAFCKTQHALNGVGSLVCFVVGCVFLFAGFVAVAAIAARCCMPCDKWKDAKRRLDKETRAVNAARKKVASQRVLVEQFGHMVSKTEIEAHAQERAAEYTTYRKGAQERLVEGLYRTRYLSAMVTGLLFTLLMAGSVSFYVSTVVSQVEGEYVYMQQNTNSTDTVYYGSDWTSIVIESLTPTTSILLVVACLSGVIVATCIVLILFLLSGSCCPSFRYRRDKCCLGVERAELIKTEHAVVKAYLHIAKRKSQAGPSPTETDHLEQLCEEICKGSGREPLFARFMRTHCDLRDRFAKALATGNCLENRHCILPSKHKEGTCRMSTSGTRRPVINKFEDLCAALHGFQQLLTTPKKKGGWLNVGRPEAEGGASSSGVVSRTDINLGVPWVEFAANVDKVTGEKKKENPVEEALQRALDKHHLGAWDTGKKEQESVNGWRALFAQELAFVFGRQQYPDLADLCVEDNRTVVEGKSQQQRGHGGDTRRRVSWMHVKSVLLGLAREGIENSKAGGKTVKSMRKEYDELKRIFGAPENEKDAEKCFFADVRNGEGKVMGEHFLRRTLDEAPLDSQIKLLNALKEDFNVNNDQPEEMANKARPGRVTSGDLNVREQEWICCKKARSGLDNSGDLSVREQEWLCYVLRHGGDTRDFCTVQDCCGPRLRQRCPGCFHPRKAYSVFAFCCWRATCIPQGCCRHPRSGQRCCSDGKRYAESKAQEVKAKASKLHIVGANHQRLVEEGVLTGSEFSEAYRSLLRESAGAVRDQPRIFVKEASAESPIIITKNRSCYQRALYLFVFVVDRAFPATQFLFIAMSIGYVMLVAQWFVLGAVLNPTKMLPYAAAAGTLVGFVTTKAALLRSVRKDGMRSVVAVVQEEMKGALLKSDLSLMGVSMDEKVTSAMMTGDVTTLANAAMYDEEGKEERGER